MKKIEDFGYKIGELEKGRLNKITDITGIKVGHSTIDTEENKTGITVILPREDNIYKNNFLAASYIINGYGKTTGLVQVEELGTIESILAFTNTLNVGLVYDSLVEYTINEARKDNIDLTSYNPIIFECNDSYLNNIKKRKVNEQSFLEAIKNAKIDFEEGDVGAGKGMSCYQLKGGIGSSSRIINLEGKKYTVGSLVLTNHGRLPDFIINGEKIGLKIDQKLRTSEEKVEGSIIIVLATDAPLSSRQLKRLAKRSVVGLAKTGSYINHGSGDIVLAFSTANTISRDNEEMEQEFRFLRESQLNNMFKAVAESVEESILNSMTQSNTVEGYKGRTRYSLKEFL